MSPQVSTKKPDMKSATGLFLAPGEDIFSFVVVGGALQRLLIIMALGGALSSLLEILVEQTEWERLHKLNFRVKNP